MPALNSRIVLQARAAGEDAAGHPNGAWVTIAPVWGDIRHPKGLEQIRAGAQTSAVITSMRINRRAGISAGMRAVHAGVTYNIQAVLPDEVERQYMYLVCEATA